MTVLFLLVALATASPGEPTTPPPPPAAAAPAETVTLQLVVDGGFQPTALEAPAGHPVKIVVTKKDWSGCTREIVFPDQGIRKTLPTGDPVSIELPPLPAGVVPFTCGMGMVKGTLTLR